TNNMGMEPPDAPQSVVRAIQKGVLALRAKLPGVQVLVLGLPPSGIEARSALRQRIQSTNALLAAASWPEGVSYLPTYAALVDEQDLWKLALTVDGTHFSATGYEELARLIGPVLHKTLKPL
ncbi:MAG: SGNH/GDSL hydrolase family protein, partial [Verrucomicrobium sp.]